MKQNQSKQIYVTDAINEWYSEKSVAGFITLKFLNEENQGTFYTDLDWLGIQAIQYDVGFPIDFESEIEQFINKHFNKSKKGLDKGKQNKSRKVYKQ